LVGEGFAVYDPAFPEKFDMAMGEYLLIGNVLFQSDLLVDPLRAGLPK
jgi:hypothetical protein